MSNYTMTLGEVIQLIAKNEGLNTRDLIEKGRRKLFDFEYPIFDPDYKKVFETHFIRKFYMREIGFETEGLFKFNLETWLIINMPYFNQLFKSELIEFDPLENSRVDVTANKQNDKTQNDARVIDQEGSTKGKTKGTQDNTKDSNIDTTNEMIDDNFERDINSETPDGRLNLTANDGEGVIEYASRINESNENNKSNSTGNTKDHTTNKTNSTVDNTVDNTLDTKDSLDSKINEIEDYVQHRAGKIGVQSYSKLLEEYRGSFLRIEKQIFDEMQELFMLVY